MKFVCLGYYDPKKFESLPDSERNQMFDEAFAYDDELRAAGHFLGGPALEPHAAKTLRGKNGKVTVTDGPYAETKEQIGGILFLEARDINHAVELMSKHPAVRLGFSTFEIRPEGDIAPIMEESKKRRAVVK
ncbi:MAG TPA: YciI family protein [Terriglobales bacterium]|nr:YciI family protein [Terriglobales bacterium]